jgi:hypothetical protein
MASYNRDEARDWARGHLRGSTRWRVRTMISPRWASSTNCSGRDGLFDPKLNRLLPAGVIVMRLPAAKGSSSSIRSTRGSHPAIPRRLTTGARPLPATRPSRSCARLPTSRPSQGVGTPPPSSVPQDNLSSLAALGDMAKAAPPSSSKEARVDRRVSSVSRIGRTRIARRAGSVSHRVLPFRSITLTARGGRAARDSPRS